MQAKVSARWTGQDLDYVTTNKRGNEVLMGGKAGVPPTHMMLMGLAGCMGMDVLSILQKKRQDVTNIEVDIIAHSADEHPRPFETIELAFRVQGNNIKPNAIERAIDLSITKYCPVGQTLQTKVVLQTSFTIEETTEETTEEA